MKRSMLSVTTVLVLVALELDSSIVSAEEPGHYTYYQVRPHSAITNPKPIVSPVVRLTTGYEAPAIAINRRNPIASPGIPLTNYGSPLALKSRPSRVLMLQGAGTATGLPGRRVRLRSPRGRSRVGGSRVVRLLNSGNSRVLRPSVGVRIPGGRRVFIVRKNGTEWDYTPVYGERGPHCGLNCILHARGLRQSPVNIRTKHVSYGVMDPVNTINFHTQPHTFAVTYDGTTVKATPKTAMLVNGVGVRGQMYTVANIHFHWSSRHLRGSEHALDGVRFPLELHILCYMNKYRTFEEAKKHKDGLAAVSVIFDFGKECPALRTILTATDLMRQPGEEVPVLGLDVTKLLPARLDHFFRYHGSITTPPCSENVYWTVYEHVQTMSTEQFRMFQELRRGRFGKSTVVNSNARPLQASFNRPILSNNPLFVRS